MKNAVRMSSVLLCVVLLAGQALPGDVSLSIAASLKDVMDELTATYATRHPGSRFSKYYGASGTLARQIESGAPSDIFISANLEWMDYLKSKSLVDPAGIGTFAYNTLVFAGTPGKASTMRDLWKLDRIAIGSPRSVPAGEYAMEALKKAGMDEQFVGKLVMAKDVRECLVYAERGEVDGAFVYRTDALRATQAQILFTVPQDLYPRIVYFMSLTVLGSRNADAEAFLIFLRGDEASKVLVKYGFATQ